MMRTSPANRGVVGRWWRRWGAGLAFASLLGGVEAQAQEPGRITGQVTTRSSAPLSSVQVFLVGTTQGALTNAQGRFTITNVAPGTYQEQAELIGYQTITHEV